jgi:hypothetical protein
LGLLLRALGISLLVRIGLLLMTPIGAVTIFFLPFSNRAQHRISGGMFFIMMVTPLVLAFALFWWAWLRQSQLRRSYRGLPLLAAVLGFLIAAMPLPFDRAPSLLTYGAKAVKRAPVPVQVLYLTERFQTFFDACTHPDDCDPTSEGTPRRCAAATDGERMCVEVSQGGCCPTEAGCAEGWVCVWLMGPSRNSRVMSGFDSSDGCVPAERASRFREIRPPPSCTWRRGFLERGPDE